MKAYLVIDLGFGDSGKGLLTDFLVRRTGAGLVVRYNGGAQAGHNVHTPEGTRHTFSQFGSGSFVPGVKTFLSRHVLVHPSALLVEGQVLEKKGVQSVFERLRISEEARIITPFHQAANHIREMARGQKRHGSCGVGVGETAADALAHPESCILAADLYNLPRLRRKLNSLREYKKEQLSGLFGKVLSGDEFAREWEIFESEDVIENWLSMIAPLSAMGLVVPDAQLQDWLRGTEQVVFEGAQGVLLDEDLGFFPYTTWSRCTDANALDMLSEMAPEAEAFRIGQLRSYAVRHGPGPLPSEAEIFNPLVREDNHYNDWQGNVRYGFFDALLARYALAANGGVDTLMITHLDTLKNLKEWTYSAGYMWPAGSAYAAAGEGILEEIPSLSGLTLEEQAQFSQALYKAKPLLKTCPADEEEVLARIEDLCGQKVGLVSSGPSAGDVRLRGLSL